MSRHYLRIQAKTTKYDTFTRDLAEVDRAVLDSTGEGDGYPNCCTSQMCVLCELGCSTQLEPHHGDLHVHNCVSAPFMQVLSRCMSCGAQTRS